MVADSGCSFHGFDGVFRMSLMVSIVVFIQGFSIDSLVIGF